MPGRNGTGPAGYGPMTGRGQGCCTKSDSKVLGRRFSRGFARGCCDSVQLSNEDQKEFLTQRKTHLENELENLQKSIDEL